MLITILSSTAFYDGHQAQYNVHYKFIFAFILLILANYRINAMSVCTGVTVSFSRHNMQDVCQLVAGDTN